MFAATRVLGTRHAIPRPRCLSTNDSHAGMGGPFACTGPGPVVAAGAGEQAGRQAGRRFTSVLGVSGEREMGHGGGGGGAGAGAGACSRSWPGLQSVVEKRAVQVGAHTPTPAAQDLVSLSVLSSACVVVRAPLPALHMPTRAPHQPHAATGPRELFSPILHRVTKRGPEIVCFSSGGCCGCTLVHGAVVHCAAAGPLSWLQRRYLLRYEVHADH
jgi:hypothetical protein